MTHKMSFIFILLTGIVTATAHAGNIANLGPNSLALQGYDVVSYFKKSGPLKGSSQYQVQYEGANYQFANEENKQEFQKTPAKFAPEFGGWCAYAVADSKSKVEIDPKSYLIQEGRLLLFYNGFWGDTRDKWLHTKNKDSKTFLKEADSNWPETKSKEP